MAKTFVEGGMAALLDAGIKTGQAAPFGPYHINLRTALEQYR